MNHCLEPTFAPQVVPAGLAPEEHEPARALGFGLLEQLESSVKVTEAEGYLCLIDDRHVPLRCQLPELGKQCASLIWAAQPRMSDAAV